MARSTLAPSTCRANRERGHVGWADTVRNNGARRGRVAKNVRSSPISDHWQHSVHEFDIALKNVLRQLSGTVMAMLAGFPVEHWHNVELGQVHSLRVDLLGETGDRTLVHIELQSTNDPVMALRMAEYSLSIFRRFGRWPVQTVLYVGQAPMRMDSSLAGPRVRFAYNLVDVRELDGEPLLASEVLEENILAILFRLGNQRKAVRRILERIAASDVSVRATALAELTILAGLRKMESVLKEETEQMPLLNDIMDHDLFGPRIRQATDLGRAEGRAEGEQTIVIRLLEKRFGTVPAWARQRIEAMPATRIEQVAIRLLDAESLEELLG